MVFICFHQSCKTNERLNHSKMGKTTAKQSLPLRSWRFTSERPKRGLVDVSDICIFQIALNGGGFLKNCAIATVLSISAALKHCFDNFPIFGACASNEMKSEIFSARGRGICCFVGPKFPPRRREDVIQKNCHLKRCFGSGGVHFMSNFHHEELVGSFCMKFQRLPRVTRIASLLGTKKKRVEPLQNQETTT